MLAQRSVNCTQGTKAESDREGLDSDSSARVDNTLTCRLLASRLMTLVALPHALIENRYQ